MKINPIQLLFFLLLASMVAACTVIPSGNYTLESGQTVRGDLWVLSGNSTFEEGSQITGSAYVFSGNVLSDGAINKHLVVTSGNVTLGPDARVGGDVITPSGNVTQASTARIEGRGSLFANIFFGGLLILAICASPFLLLAILLVWVIRRRNKATPAPAVGGEIS
jgi:hypothetical protein